MGTPLRACIVMLLLLASRPGVCAQSGAASATLTGQVSGAVAVSATETLATGDRARVSTAHVDATTIAVSVSSTGGDEARVSLPLRLRSNVSYALRASFVSPGELAVRLSVAGVRATGNFVHADALEGIRLDETFAAWPGERAPFLTARNRPLSVVILSGPPISKAGSFNSPDNAIEVVLSIELRPQAGGEPWSTRLTISAAPHR